MNLKQFFLIENECYKANVKMTPKGFMLHSTGANNPTLKRYVPDFDGTIGKNIYNNHWNQPRPDGKKVCVHGFIGKLANEEIATIQTLPWNMRGWHCAGKGNDYLIGIEICEDGLTDANYFNKVYKEAVEVVSMLTKMYGWNPDTDIIDHAEGHKKGIASNHGDVTYWFAKHGKTMNDFRRDVKAMVNGQTVAEVSPKMAEKTAEKITGSIAQIQLTLNQRYGLNIAIDNIYGKETKKALVKGLQTELNKQYGKGLVVDGIFGNNTKNACVTVKKGAKGNITYLIQAMLVCKGYNTNGVDGIFGSGTESAVKQFQNNNGLTVDSIVGKNTFEKLFQ